MQVNEGMITMSIGSRIRFIRLKRGYTQKELGIKLGFKESTAEVRIAQYETGARIPRDALLYRIAVALHVGVDTLITQTSTAAGLLQFLFSLEDEQGLKITQQNNRTVLYFDHDCKSDFGLLMQQLTDLWAEKANLLRSGKISQEEYDNWRYTFPEAYGEKYGPSATWSCMAADISEEATGSCAKRDFDDHEFLDLEYPDDTDTDF